MKILVINAGSSSLKYQLIDMDSSEVLAAVAILPLAMRTAIHLHYFEQMSVKEIADSMGRSESSVKTLLFRGRQRLKELLES